ncbi:MAG: 16S rRNA (uracil(1498)-N(3))-methyltransferase [Clostridia bacterium]|nr:16S rRNA (uracil(1498)-N(3))-methyltransferase [Clostridia bacterium]
MPKFFVHSNQIEASQIKIVGEDVKHISSVLRIKIGEEITICNQETKLNYLAKITTINKEAVFCQITDCIKPFVESNIKITVFQGLPKANKMEYIIQKATELGATKIVPVAMQRSIVKLEEKTAPKKIERWQKIAETAAKQSGRDYIPKIEQVQTISMICEKMQSNDLTLLAYENEQKTTLKEELKKFKIKPEGANVGMIIGPEGGLDSKEVEILIAAGAKPVTLGKRILRTETASITMISDIMYEYEM